MAKGAYIGVQKLPSGYTELTHIESTGTQYINTDFNPNQNTRVVMDAQFLENPTSNTICYFGARVDSTRYELHKVGGDLSLFFLYNSNLSLYFPDFDFTVRRTVEINKNTATVDGVTESYDSETFQVSQPIFLGANNNNGTATSMAAMRIYSCQIYDNGTLVRNYVPCKNSSNVVGLYDIVNSQFYGDANGGIFLTGASIYTSVARKIKTAYIGVDGIARKIKSGYIGVEGVARQCWCGYDPVFANNTWEQIIEACQSGSVPSTWVVGDQKPMTINGTDYPIDIIGINHDTYSDGSGTAPLTFQMHNLYTTEYAMHTSEKNVWSTCSMRKTTLPSLLLQMPSEVQAAIKEVDKITASGNGSSTLATTSEKLFLLSCSELGWSPTHAVSGEGATYAYYSEGGTSALAKVKNGSSSASFTMWWLRSPYMKTSNNKSAFFRVDSYNIEFMGGTATIEQSVSFAFCF